jgi:quercetin dioxygenase-like cupin family protein
MTQQTIDLHINRSDEANVGPEQTLFIPRGAIHRFDNNGMQDEKALCVITPAAIVPQYFGESVEGFNEAEGGELARW